MLKKLTGNERSKKRIRDERFAKHYCAWPCDMICNGDYELNLVNMADERVKY
jgi:hypothetical protein